MERVENCVKSIVENLIENRARSVDSDRGEIFKSPADGTTTETNVTLERIVSAVCSRANKYLSDGEWLVIRNL